MSSSVSDTNRMSLFTIWEELKPGLSDLDEPVLARILGFIPLRDRFRLSRVSRAFCKAVDATVTSLAFFRDSVDLLPDETIRGILQKHGGKINHLNFDLFRSSLEDPSQWPWRQSIISTVKLCPNLTELDMLICARHRLRDNDLSSIFQHCKKLQKIRIDAQFLNGHCFNKAPFSLIHVELEMCYRISEPSFNVMMQRFRKLKTLHMSQLLILNDEHVQTMARNFRSLRCLSLVMHPESKLDLSGPGLAQFGCIRGLRMLCLEGMGAVTDRTLQLLSTSMASPSIVSISLAFCFNVSMHGLKHLARMPRLVNLNLDGITKRDISLGLEHIANEGRLQRLFVAERANVSPGTLRNVIDRLPNLLLLDISSNEEIINWGLPVQLVGLWPEKRGEWSEKPPRAPLTILTDEHLVWNLATAPDYEYGTAPPLRIHHIHRNSLSESVKDARILSKNIVWLVEVLPTTLLSSESTSAIPPSILMPSIRRGNRYRVLWAPLGPTKEVKFELFDDQKENFPPLPPLPQGEAGDGLLQSPTYPPEGGRKFDLYTWAEKEDKRGCEDWDFFSELDYKASTGEQLIPPEQAKVPRASRSVISHKDDPHSKDWSMDVLDLLLKTHAYEDGSTVGNMHIREGVILRKDRSVEDIFSSLTREGTSIQAYHPVSCRPARPDPSDKFSVNKNHPQSPGYGSHSYGGLSPFSAPFIPYQAPPNLSPCSAPPSSFDFPPPQLPPSPDASFSFAAFNKAVGSKPLSQTPHHSGSSHSLHRLAPLAPRNF